MKYLENKKYRIIYDRTASGFEKKLNDAIEDLEEYKPEVTISESRPSGFLAYMTYTIDRKIPENIADELEIRGLQIKCSDCPYCEIPKDNRKKKAQCQYATYGITFADSPCCNKFYEDLIEMFYEYKANKLIENYEISSSMKLLKSEQYIPYI